MKGKSARVLAWIAGGQLVVMAVTGVYLYFEYRPSTGWLDLPPRLDTAVKVERVVRGVHRIDAWLLVPTLVALAIVVTMEQRHRVEAWLIVVAGAVAGFTGLLLPWDQLALWDVVVGTNFKGVHAAWSDQVRFVLIGGAEVGPAVVQRWFIVHVVVAMLVAVGVVRLLVARRSDG